MKRFINIFALVLLVLMPMKAYGITSNDLDSVVNNSVFYDDADSSAACTSDSTGTTAGASTGASSLNGYSLPATTGQTGREEPIDASGAVPSSGQKVDFAQFAALGQPYRDYYVNMLWQFASWDWGGHSQMINQAEYNWMAAAPRKLLITNPKTGKSIVAVALETGPGPSIGSTWRAQHGNSSDTVAPYWPGFQKTRPAQADGMVAGMPPAALAALGLTDADIDPSYAKGGVTTSLNYAWAPDQSAIPGPSSTTGATATEASTTTDTTGTTGTCCDTATQAGATAGSGSTITLTGSSNLEKVMAYLMDKSGPGFTLAGAAGALGNMIQESGPNLKPNRQEEGADHAFPKGGWGIAQWTAGRRPPLVTLVNNAGLSRLYTDDESAALDLSPADNDALLKVELAYMSSELNGDYGSTLSAGRSATDPSQAAFDWENTYEGCTPTYSEEECGVPDRRTAATQIYNQYLAQADKTGGITTPAAPTSATATPATTTSAASTCTSSGTTTGSTAAGSGLDGTLLSYAWPTYISGDAGGYKQKPAYTAAAQAANAKGHYIGDPASTPDGTVLGDDCSGFVSLLIINSGFDPNFVNGNGGDTADMYAWMSSSPRYKKIGETPTLDVSQLQPGDIAVNPGSHVFIFVGNVPGFSKEFASASSGEVDQYLRAPMAAHEDQNYTYEGSYTWFRKISS